MRVPYTRRDVPDSLVLEVLFADCELLCHSLALSLRAVDNVVCLSQVNLLNEPLLFPIKQAPGLIQH